MRVYIGIDGGGTKTRAVVVTSQGQLLADRTTDGCNVNHYGWDYAQQVLSGLFAGLRGALPEQAIVAAVYLGLAGIDREEDRQRMQAFVQTQWQNTPVGTQHDALPALVSGSGQMAGIVLIGGTGSIAFGINEAGEEARVGGWGYLISDEGSGYDIGKRALRAVMQSYDGRLPQTLLTQLVLEQHGLQDEAELIPLVYAESFTRDSVAAVTRLVFQAAERGDEVSLHLLQEAADDLSELVRVLLHRLPFSQASIPVVVTGGLFHKGSPLGEWVQARLGANVQVMVGERPPVVGALLLAQKLSGDSWTSELADGITRIT